MEEDLRDIGSKQGVRYLVGGGIRKQGDRLRITDQLVDADDDLHVWSEAYDRTMDAVFAVREEIAETIAERLEVSLRLEPNEGLVAPTSDIHAYDLYLRAKALVRERGAGIREAVRLDEDLVARDSTWAPGWAGLAQAYFLVPYQEGSGQRGMVRPEWWESALGSVEVAAKRALALHPRVAGANVAPGNAHRDRWEWEQAERQYIRALQIELAIVRGPELAPAYNNLADGR